MTTSQVTFIQPGVVFPAYYADGSFDFTVVATGTVGDPLVGTMQVAIAVMDDEHYGYVRKPFSFEDIRRALGESV